MHTKDFLAQELRKAGLEEMAVKAEAGYYHDFLSDIPFPEMALDEDLVRAMQAGNVAAHALRKRHHNGEFDATAEEVDEWAVSKDGIDAFAMLVTETKKDK